MEKAIKYLKRITKGLTPSERKMYVERIYEHFRRESISYVNGKPIPVSTEVEDESEARLEKEEDPTGALIY